MHTIEPHIKSYIDLSVRNSVVIASKNFRIESDRSIKMAVKEANENSKRHMSVILEEFKNSLKAFKEVAPKIPTEERIREIVHEEIQPLSSDVRICISEIGQINKKLYFHERRIRKLELAVA